MIESELSFLVKKPPTLDGIPSKEIEQHYLTDSPSSLRVRRAGGTFELTKKIMVDPNDLSRNDELTIPLDAEEYHTIAEMSDRALRKTRYYFRLEGGLTAELDVFKDELEGLMTVEVEFPDEKTRAAFVPPPWFGRDVSQEEWSTNFNLAAATYDDVKPHLSAKK